MGILDQLSSATGDKSSNTDLAKHCLLTPALLHSVAEGLRTGSPKAKEDCAQILDEVAQRRPEILADFVNDLLDASRSSNKRIAKLGFSSLVRAVTANPAEVFAERDYLLQVGRNGGPLSFGALAVLAALCKDNPNYRGKLIGHILRLIPAVTDKDLPKWVATVGPAVEGSADCVKKLTLALDPRRSTLPEAARKKIDKNLVKLERSTVKTKRR